jgi:hypothetical protein
MFFAARDARAEGWRIAVEGCSKHSGNADRPGNHTKRKGTPRHLSSGVRF